MTTTSKDLERSGTWRFYAHEIEKDFDAGVPFPEIHMMNIVIKQRTLEPYKKHRARLDEFIWHDDPNPKTIIELGAGYGAMANVWPAGSRVFNVDLPEMLKVQASYLVETMGATVSGEHDEIFTLPDGTVIELVVFTDADRLPFDGAYFFSTWALTETTLETWAYYIERAKRLAGIYAVGWSGWVDIPGVYWPWGELRDQFQSVRANLLPYLEYDGTPTESVELAAVNR